MTVFSHGATSIAVSDSAAQYTGSNVETCLTEARAAGIKSRPITIGHADLTESTNAVPQSINLGAAMPAGAVILGHDINQSIAFDGECTLDVGGTDADAIVALEVVGTGAALTRRNGLLGILSRGFFGGQQLTATFTPGASNNLAALSAGSVTITIWYVEAP